MDNITLELELDPAVAAALPRAPALARLRNGAAGRVRPVAEALVWLDTAEGRLAAAGLALEQDRSGARRLLRVRPPLHASGPVPWRPGLPAELLATLPAGAAPEEAGSGTLMPIAAFEGRRSLMPLATEDGPAEAELLAGRLRTVAAERPAARLRLTGPTGPVLALAEALAADLPLLPPRQTLAEAGRLLARGSDGGPAAGEPRRRGAPDLGGAEGVEQALTLAIGHLAEVLLWHLPLARADAGPEGVHQSRVALRRLRSVLRVFRPAADAPELRGLDAALKELATLLGPARDWDVFRDGLGAELAAALPGERRLAGLLRASAQRRAEAYAALEAALAGPALRLLLLRVVAVVETAPWRADETDEAAAARRAQPLPEFAAWVLQKRWRKLAEVGPDLKGLPDESLHALRLQGKKLRYAAELFAPLWPGKPTRRFLKRLAAVQEAFGQSNDVVVARGLVAGLAGRGAGRAWAMGVAEGLALGHAKGARKRAERAWRKLLGSSCFWDQ